MRRASTKAIVLRRINYEEADRILTVITPEYGKVSLFAKGVRRSKSKLAGGLELFSISDIVFIDGKNDLKTVVSARLDRHFGSISKNITTTMLAYDFLKLIDQYTQDTCEREFFELLEHSLHSLHEQHEDSLLVRIWFAVQLLHRSGESINLDQQVSGAPFEEGSVYAFDFEDHGFYTHRSGTYGSRHIKFLRLLSKVDSPENLLRVEHAKDLSGDVYMLLDHCLRT